jgi:hypothetical protein
MRFYLYVTNPALLEDPEHQSTYGEVGALISESSQPIEPIPGCAVKQAVQQNDRFKWDKSAQDVVATGSDRKLNPDGFFRKFTDAEYELYIDLNNANVKKYFETFTQHRRKIDLDSPRFIRVLDMLVNLGVLTTPRAVEITS